MSQTQSLHETLFQLLVAEEPGRVADLVAQLSRVGTRELAEHVADLLPHKVYPLLAHRLRQAGANSELPADVSAPLDAALAESRALNGLLMLSLSRVLAVASQLGLTPPALLKGALFADSYYPEAATRPMADFDILSAPGEARALQQALARAGFVRSPFHVVQGHAVAFENAQGVACDAHVCLEMHPHAPWRELTREVTLRRLRGVRAAALQPDVMLAHLLEHMHGHLDELGLVLLWLVDLVFVLRKHATELTADGVRAYVTEPRAWAFGLRVLGLLESLGEPLPRAFASLREEMRRVGPLSLAEVLRLRRTRPWGLPHAFGFVRLAAQSLGVRDYAPRAKPSLYDLLCLPMDALLARKRP